MKISVILPVKNPDIELLKKALESVCNQTYQDFEILLINDGSNPEYSEPLKRIASETPGAKLFEIPASGVSVARNFAAEKAEGDILTYLDSDDQISPLCFEEAVNILTNTELDALWGGTFYGPEAEIQNRIQHSIANAKSFDELKDQLIYLDAERMHKTKAECIGEPYRFGDGTYVNRGVAARFIRKSANVNFPKGLRIYEDAIWNLTALKSQRIAYVQREWYYYLENEKSVSNSYNPDILENLETPLGVIRGLLDMDNKEEYSAYTRILMDSLRYVYKCLYGNPNWKPDAGEKKKVKAHIYNDEPWREIETAKYMEAASERDRQKAKVFKMKQLLTYWKLTWK